MQLSDLTSVFQLNKEGNPIRDLWDKFSSVPKGPAIFNKIIGWMVPYTGSVSPNVLEVRAGFARVSITEHRAIRNHLKSIHAIALINLAELAGNIALLYGMPDDARFIVAGLEAEYVKKARGTITATAAAPIVETNEKRNYTVPVELTDESGEVVTRVTLNTLVGPKKASS